MIAYLLDTNIVSFLLKQTEPSLEERFMQTPRTQVAVSSVTEAELRYGVAKLAQEARLPGLVDAFLRSVEVLAWDALCARTFATLRAELELQGMSMGYADTMLAAHALTLGLTFVTNDKAFARVPGLKLEDWTSGLGRA